jgi:hypothetical protein
MRLLALALMLVVVVVVFGLVTGMAPARADPPQSAHASSNLRTGGPLSWPETWPEALTFTIQQDSDDGTEADSIWFPGGYVGCLNCAGRAGDCCFVGGLRFSVPDLEQGQTVRYARLRLAAQGGEVTSAASLLVTGADEDSSATFSETRRPSQLPATSAGVVWIIANQWKSAGDCMGLYYSSANLAPIVNEILARPDWGTGGEKAIILILTGDTCPAGESNYAQYEDYGTEPEQRDAAILEVYPTLAHAFVGKPILGRPTDASVTVNVINLLPLDVFVEYGVAPGSYTYSTDPLLNQPGGQPIDIALESLQADENCYYRIRYREPGESVYLSGMEGRFHTQRQEGSTFTFTIQADSHLWAFIRQGNHRSLRLYERTIENTAADNPDFHISLGDFVHTEIYADRCVLTPHEAVERYLEQRKYLDKLLHSIPFYLVMGNHEAEQGWRVADPGDSVPEWSALARKTVIPNPEPDGFYSGDTIPTTCCGLREDYYAWHWGDALFVVLDPFWYTTVKPHSNGGGEGSEDPWDWTLGEDQYNWLYETLHSSSAAWKFVFIHHLTGGVRSPYGMFQTPYGRGGIEAAKYKVDQRGSYEWGGEDEFGSDVFAAERPGWAYGPVHEMLVNEGVSILFHGHDHVFVRQTLDGVIYQECPQPSDSDYGEGFYEDGHYVNGAKANNSGHIRVTVRPDYVQVHYVRSVLPEDEPLVEDGQTIYNGTVCFSYAIGIASVKNGAAPGARPRLSRGRPNPFAHSARLELSLPRPAWVSAEIYDVRGRIVRRLVNAHLQSGPHRLEWDGRCEGGSLARQGVYFCRLRTGEYTEARKLVLRR